MSYPIQSLVIIAPILFIVLMIVAPLIGVFAGWKRAAYWGGGSFFFYLVGVLVWFIAGNKIAQLILNALSGVLKDVTITQDLVRSVAAPAFFIAVMMVAELILLINYYAWFKRVSKIKQDVKLKKEIKQAKKDGKKLKKGTIPSSGWSQMQLTTKGKIINMTCGGAGLALLMAPSSVSFTQAIFYLTTNSATRANSKFASGLYDSLLGTAKAFSWMSYYQGTKSATECDSLFSMLNVYTSTTSYKTMSVDISKETPYDITITLSEKESKSNGFQAFADIMKAGMIGVMTTSGYPEKDVPTHPQPYKYDKIVESIKAFSEIWNPLIETFKLQFGSTFNSTNTCQLLVNIIKNEIKKQQPQEIKDEIVENAFSLEEGSTFLKISEAYETLENKLTPIIMPQESYDLLFEVIESMFDTSQLSTDTYKEWWDAGLKFVMQMMFQVQ